MAERRSALLVGIDGYPDQPTTGCCNDAREMARLLARHHDDRINWSVEKLLGRDASVPVASTAEVVARLARHFEQADDRHLLFYFSGHARRSALGVELCTQDGTGVARGIPIESLMILARRAMRAGALSVTLILDCCFAGQIGDADGDGLSLSDLPEDVVVLASSRSADASAQGDAHSPFTEWLLAGLEGAAADDEGRVDALSLFLFATKALRGRGPHPKLKANCDSLPTLRTAASGVDARLIQGLQTLFATASVAVDLGETVRWDGGPVRPDAPDDVRAAALLWELRQHGLVEGHPPGTLRYLAAHHGTLRLTVRGRSFLRRHQRGEI